MTQSMICAGIDAGSRAIKIVLVDADTLSILASGSADQGVDQNGRTEALLGRLLSEVGASRTELAGAVATGYARHIVSAAQTTVTEITCHARGVIHVRPNARTVLEIGGQDSKLLRLDGRGAVRDFSMNDRCAAGTGRFLEVVAQRLNLPLDELGAMARRSAAPAPISSMCVVFAETEIIGLLAGGASPADIAAGVQASIAERVAAMAGRRLERPVVFTGGVALVDGMAPALQRTLEVPIEAVDNPQYTGALGAALLAAGSK